MESMKALLKSKSSNELITSPTSAQCVSAKKQSDPLQYHGSTVSHHSASSQLLQVPSVHSGASSLVSSSVSESSELSQLSDCEPNDYGHRDSGRKLKKLQKSIRKQRKRNEKQLAELVQFLHVNQPQTNGFKMDDEDIKCLNGNVTERLNKSLQEYLDPNCLLGEPKRKIVVCKSLDIDNRPSVNGSNGKKESSAFKSVDSAPNGPKFQIGADPEDDADVDYAEANERTLTSNDTITAAGFRRIRRFGYDVADGCGFPLSLKREDEDEHTLTLTRRRSWKEIIARSDEYMHKHTIGSKKLALQQLYQVCPCPEVQCNSLSGVLPFRRWNSECRLPANPTLDRTGSFVSGSSGSSGSKDVLNGACNWGAFQRSPRRHSCEDLRHLSGCSLRNTQNHLKNMPSIPRQRSFGPMSDISGCYSSELSSELSTSCSLRSVSSSCSSISGVSTLIALDLNQLGMHF
jgi:hypothetical protein